MTGLKLPIQPSSQASVGGKSQTCLGVKNPFCAACTTIAKPNNPPIKEGNSGPKKRAVTVAGIVKASPEKKAKEWFEVIVGKSITDAGDVKCFGGVTSYDQKPKRRLFEVLKSQGMQMNQQVTFLSDGGDNVRELQLYLNPQAEHLLDWGLR